MSKSKHKNTFNTKNETDSVSRDLGNRKKFHVHDVIGISPKTENQEKLMEAIFDDVPLVAALNYPGVGKTFISLYCALNDVFDSSTPYEKIILVRSAVEGRQIGALPGTVEEKLQEYEVAYEDIVKELMPKYKDAYNHLKSLGYLEFHSTSFLRSKTFNNSIIIVSEAQNLDYGELFTIITRLGHNSKMIIEGDGGLQNDLVRTREKSGLPNVRKILSKLPEESSRVIEFGPEDIIRSKFVKDFILAADSLGMLE